MKVTKHITIEISSPEEIQLLSDVAEVARVVLADDYTLIVGGMTADEKRKMMHFLTTIFDATH